MEQKMSELTEVILNFKNEGESETKFVEKMGISKQKFQAWKKNVIPEDKALYKVANFLNIDFLFLVSLAKMYDMSGSAENRTEWRKIHNQRKEYLSSKNWMSQATIGRNITENLN